MKAYRRYAFPSLSRVLAGPDAIAEAEAAEAAWNEDRLEACRQDGYEEGHAAGYAEGAKLAGEKAAREARAALDAISEPLNALVAGFTRMQHEYQSAAREQLTALVEQVAKQVVRAELEIRPEQFLAFVDEALAELPKPAERVEVRLNPDEYHRVLNVAPARAGQFALTPDAQLAPGECRISAGERELDVGCGQRLATCIEQIHALLRAGTETA
jgi:flagellar assembly protein FliH